MRQIKKVFRQVDTQADGQTDGAGPTSSISWLQEGMAGGENAAKFRREEGEKNVQSFQNHRGRSADMSKQNKKRQPEEIII